MLTSQTPTIFDYPYLHKFLPENKYLVHMVKNMQQPSNPATAAANNCHVESVEKIPKKLIQQPSCSSLSVSFLIHSKSFAQYTHSCVWKEEQSWNIKDQNVPDLLSEKTTLW